ncbi:MAG: hypothetical protein WBX01_03340 [Nitrososphaeraceae archaeon]|jgi:hypothetical protein
MSLILRRSLGQIKCELYNHEISEEEEKKLFDSAERQRYTHCSRCNTLLLSKVSDDRDDEYFLKEQ